MQAILHPTLDALVGDVDPERLHVGVPMLGPGSARPDRHEVFVTLDRQTFVWRVPSLASLYRGDAVPPDMSDYPEEYVPAFFKLERHVQLIPAAGRSPTDKEFELAFTNVRRKPEGPSQGATFDNVWQGAALMLGVYALSGAEFTAVLHQLGRSAHKWSKGQRSWNYLDFLNRTFGR